MNISLVKRISSLLVVSAFVCAFTQPAAVTNFSGTWALNEGKSELGQGGGRGVASKIVAEQKADAIGLTKTSKNFQGEEVTASETLSFDGKESESIVFGTAKKRSTLKWAADTQTFTISSTINVDRGGQSMEFKASETWSLAADGKTLSVQTSFSTPNGDITTKAVYDKQ
jgi:hypothetical protein